MPTIATQTDTELGGPQSILVRQRRDHVRLDELLHELDTAADRAAENALLTRIARLVFPHAFAEESVLWPLARRVLTEGERLTLKVEQDHQQVNELWSRLESTGRNRAADRAELLRQLGDVLREDVRDEEDALLPRLQERLDVATLRRAGMAWEAVRRTAPTRPHAVVARRPPGNVVAALPLTVLDRSRDGLDALARRFPHRIGPVATRISSGLAAAAGAVERIPPLPFGDRRETHRAG